MQQSSTLKLLYMLLFTVLTTSFSYGQRQQYKITGTVTDSVQNPLSMATVYIESVKDTSVVNYTITDAEGKFEIEGKTEINKVNFYIDYTGFQRFSTQIALKQDPIKDLGSVVLKESAMALGSVLVKGEAPPIKIKKDTLEFNASSFKTKEGANLEDLLKKLPGVTVDNDGKIQVNGKDVSKIKVNGKDFFGDDPKIATKNLPKDILEKIQVVDTKTKSEEFTGKESSSEDKTINVTIKEENNKGLFARMTGGYGTDHRFELNGIANYFKENTRVSVLGSANNINSVGFSYDEIYDAMGRNAFSAIRGLGGGGRFFGGGNGGITKSDAGGLDYTDSWGEDTDLDINYFFNRASTETASKVERENILPNRHYMNYSNSTGKNVNNNHRGNAEYEYQPDTLTRISIHPKITANNGYSESMSDTRSTEMDGTMLNSSTSENHGTVQSFDFSNNIDLTRKFGDKGGFFKVGFSNDNSNQKNQRSNYTSRDIYDVNGGVVDNDIQDQYIDENQNKDSYTIDGNVRIPLTKKWMLDLDYNYSNAHEHNKRLFYEPGQDNQYGELNDNLSSDFEVDTYKHKPNGGIVYRGDKLQAGLSGGIESIRLKNKEGFTGVDFDNTYNNLYSRFYLRYKFDQMQSIYFNYSNSSSVPSTTQLLPVINQTNPLNIITGNPDLKPTLSNNIRMNYYKYDFSKKFGIFAYIGGNYNTDEVVARTITDADLVRTTTYTNIDGSYSFYSAIGAHKEYKLGEESSLKGRVMISPSLRKDIGFSNGVKYHSDNFSVGPNFNLTYEITDVITVNPSYRISYNKTKYSLDNQNNQDYANHDVRLEVTSYWPENFVFGSDVTYTHIGETAPGFDNDYVLWNLSLGYKIWDGDGLFKVKVFDVLNQNVSTRRFTGQDYIQDTQELVLKRYMMFSFTYKLSKFGGKKKRTGGRYMRM